jgi:hypothetical protein
MSRIHGQMSQLIRKRASASRPSGQWRDDDLRRGGAALLSAASSSQAAPQDRPWMWATRHNGDIKRAAFGYESVAALAH